MKLDAQFPTHADHQQVYVAVSVWGGGRVDDKLHLKSLRMEASLNALETRVDPWKGGWDWEGLPSPVRRECKGLAEAGRGCGSVAAHDAQR